MKKITKIICLLSALSMLPALCVGVYFLDKKEAKLSPATADDGVASPSELTPYELTLNKPVTDSSSFKEVNYEYNAFAIINFSSVKAGGGVGTIAANSSITKTTVSYGLMDVKVGFTGGNLILETWYEEGEIVKNYYPLNSGETTSIQGNYFKLYSQDKDVIINNITFYYGCGAEVKRPDTTNAKITINQYSGAYMRQASDGVYYCLTGTYEGYIPQDLQIYNGNTVLPIDDILLTANNRFTIRCNLYKHYINTSGLSFIPHLRYNGKDYGVINTTYQVDNGAIGVNSFIDYPNARFCTWYLENKNIPAFSVQSRPVFEFNGSVRKTEHRFGTVREKEGVNDFYYPYIIRVVQTNSAYNFNAEKDYEALKFWDFVDNEVHEVLPYKAQVVEKVTTDDGKSYDVIDFYISMISILKKKINGNNHFRGDKKDTFCFHFTVNHTKEGNKIITNSPYDYLDQRVVLDSTLGKSGWGGWPHSEAEDTRDYFYVSGKGRYKVGCPIMDEMPAFGMYEKLGG